MGCRNLYAPRPTQAAATSRPRGAFSRQPELVPGRTELSFACPVDRAKCRDRSTLSGSDPYYWPAAGYIAVDTIPGPTRKLYAITIPTGVTYASVSIYAAAGQKQRLRVAVILYLPDPQTPPTGAGQHDARAQPIYALADTTQYVRTNDYFVGDAIARQPTGLQLRFRVSSIVITATQNPMPPEPVDLHLGSGQECRFGGV